MKKLITLFLLISCPAFAQTVSDLSLSQGIPIISSCGSGTLVAGSTDHRGQITGVTAATACTITFSSPLKAAPVCIETGSVALAAGLLSSISTTAVTFGMTAFTGTLYYLCF